ncbi:MAG: DUF502 domain-containing protein [Leadbetterella sp.]
MWSAFRFVDSLIEFRFNLAGSGQELIIPGLGFITVVGGTALIGFIFTKFLPLRFQNYVERGIGNLPLVKIFYSAFKDLISAFVGDKKKFQTPVLVITNKQSNIRKIGFLTQENLDFLELSNTVAVYCPHSYAFSGEMLIVPKDHVQILSISASEAMKMIVSGGVSGDDA